MNPSGRCATCGLASALATPSVLFHNSDIIESFDHEKSPKITQIS